MEEKEDPIQLQIEEPTTTHSVATNGVVKKTRKRKNMTMGLTTTTMKEPEPDQKQQDQNQAHQNQNQEQKGTKETKKKAKLLQQVQQQQPTFECNVCCTEGKINSRFKPVECTSCQYLVCLPCQKMYGKLDCMNCHVVFRSKWALDTLGTVFVTKTAKQNKVKELMLLQREELKTIGPLVKWTEKMRVFKKNQKYGVVRQAPEKPDRFMNAFSFHCGLESCRGHVRRCDNNRDGNKNEYETEPEKYKYTEETHAIVEDIDPFRSFSSDEEEGNEDNDDDDDTEDDKKEKDKGVEKEEKDNDEVDESKIPIAAMTHLGECSQCKQEYCMQCQTRWHGEGTFCNKDVLDTLKSIRESTKPCPKCQTRIHKTEGCDHMHCTFCNTFFSYQYGTISTDSSNHHYRRALLTHGKRLSPEECRVSDEDPRVPEDALRESMAAMLVIWSQWHRSAKNPVRPLTNVWNLFTGNKNNGDDDDHGDDDDDKWLKAWDPTVFEKEYIDALMDGLYNVPKAVRSLIRNEYSLQKIAEKSREKFDELQIKYTLKEITDAAWEQQVYATHVKQTMSELISNVLYMYLGSIDQFQSQLFEFVQEWQVENGTAATTATTTTTTKKNGTTTITTKNGKNKSHLIRKGVAFIETMMTEVDGLIDVINDSITEIRYDHCPNASNQVMIRKLGETNRSYCAKQGLQKGAHTDVVVHRMEVLTAKHTERPDMSQTPIRPYDYQLPHIEALEKILESSHFAIDLSPLGTGKTYTAAKIYQNGRIPYRHILSISPLSVKTKWAEVNEAFGLRLVENLTYNEIGGKRGINPTHGLLIRNDYRAEVVDDTDNHDRVHNHQNHLHPNEVRMIDKYVFTVTPYLQRLIEEGLLVVIDEFQHLKNLTVQTEACQTIVTAIMDHFLKTPVSHSRVLFMSGSPIDKQNQVPRLYRTLGIMRNPRMVSGFKYAGLNEVIDWLEVQFPNHPYLTEQIPRVSRYHDSHGYIQYAPLGERFMYNTFVHVMRGKMTHTMLKPQQQSQSQRESASSSSSSTTDPTTTTTMEPMVVVLEKYNGIFTSNNNVFEQRLEKAVSSLESLGVLTNYQRGQPGAQQAWMRQVTLRMMQIETAKLHIFELLVRKHLAEHPQKKVVLALNYTDSLEELAETLAEFNPLVLQGKTTFKRRQDILKKFQAFSTEHRLLIANFSVICAGIDLDDKHGEFPRVCLASPNYNTIAIYQLGHRFLRGLETKSSTQIFMVYSGLGRERCITESLMRKGNVMKEVLADQVEAGAATFPSDYTEYREEL